MTVIRIKGFHFFKDRHGKQRCYHRKTSTAIDLVKFPVGSLEFMGEVARITALTTKAGPDKPGTLGLLISEYKAHEAFTDLAPRTKTDYERIFNYLKPIADTPLARFSPPLVIKIRDKASQAHGRRFGNYVRSTLRLVFGWGVERGHLATNPAAGLKAIRKPKSAPDANRPWSDVEREAVLAALPAHMLLPVTLMMYCGLDPQDTLDLPKTAISDGLITTQRGKTSEDVWLPCPTPVLEALATAPKHDAIKLCANSHGKPWTGSGFRASWRPIKKRLEDGGLVQPGLTLKGLRHTVATILAEMGYDERTVADMLAQKTVEMARHYSRRANKTKKLTAVVANFEAEVNRRRTKIGKPS